jgi:hypothetical protein
MIINDIIKYIKVTNKFINKMNIYEIINKGDTERFKNVLMKQNLHSMDGMTIAEIVLYEILDNLEDGGNYQQKYYDLFKVLVDVNFPLQHLQDKMLYMFYYDLYDIAKLLFKNGLRAKDDFIEEIYRDLKYTFLHSYYPEYNKIEYQMKWIKLYLQYHYELPKSIINDLETRNYSIFNTIKHSLYMINKFNKIRIHYFANKYIQLFKKYHTLKIELETLPPEYPVKSYPGGIQYQEAMQSFYNE